MNSDSRRLTAKYILAPCGNLASFDEDSGMSYRCNRCFAVVGSMGMPKECKELYEMEQVVDKLSNVTYRQR